MVPRGVKIARRGKGMPHVWNEQYRALYDRTYRVLYDAGIDEGLADQLATQRTLAVAVSRGQSFLGTHASGRLEQPRLTTLPDATVRKTPVLRTVQRTMGGFT